MATADPLALGVLREQLAKPVEIAPVERVDVLAYCLCVPLFIGHASIETKAAGPAPVVLGLAAESWPGDPALALLRGHAASLLAAETGAAPRLEDLEARGYENLKSCLPPPLAAAR